MNESLLDKIFKEIAFNDNREAFKTLFFEFYPTLCVFAGRFISNPETCEDIVQEVFYTIWKNRKRIEVTTSFRNLLVTYVKNSCIDYLRKQDTQQKYYEKYTQKLTAHQDSPESIYTISELEKILQNSLNQLPEKVRTAFNLSREKNMTYLQIAEEMNISPKTVESYISKALKILRENLKDFLPLVL